MRDTITDECELLDEQEWLFLCKLMGQATHSPKRVAEKTVLRRKATSTCQSPIYDGFRVEVILKDQRRAYLIYKNNALYGLVTDSQTVLQNYIDLSATLPIPLAHRSPSAILLGAMIQEREYKPSDSSPLHTDFLTLVKGIAEIEYYLNRFTLTDAPQHQLQKFQNTVNQHFPGKESDFLAEGTDRQTLDAHDVEQLFSTLPLHQSEKIKLNLLHFIRNEILTRLESLKTRHPQYWDHAWDLIERQIRANLLKPFFYPNFGPIPRAQSELLFLLAETQRPDPETTESTDPTYIILQLHPKKDSIIHLLRAVAGESTARPPDFYRETALNQISIATTRTFYSAFDMLQGLFYLFRHEPAPYWSKKSEGSALTYELHGPYAALLPQDNTIKEGLLTSSAQFMEWLKGSLTLKNMGYYLASAAKSILYAVSAPFIATLHISTTLWVERSQSTFSAEDIILPCKENMLKHIRKQQASFKTLPHTSLATAAIDLFAYLQAAIEETNHIYTLANLYALYELFYTSLIDYHTPLFFAPWEEQDLPGMTSFFPAEITQELVHFMVNDLLVNQPIAAISAMILALAGTFEAPILGPMLNSVNHVMTGKSLENTAIMNRMMMGFIGFKAGLAITTLFAKEEAVWYELLSFLAKDPLTYTSAFAGIVAIGYAQVTKTYIDALQFTSCDLKASKTGLLYVFETCLAEAYEAVKLAKAPQLELALILFKQIGILHSLFLRDSLPLLNGLSDPEKRDPILEQMTHAVFSNSITSLETVLNENPHEPNAHNLQLAMHILQKFAPEALSDKKRKQWLKLIQTKKAISEKQLQILYRHFIATERTRLSNFLYHGIRLWQHTTAACITQWPSLYRSGHEFIKSTPEQLRERGFYFGKEILQYGLTLGFTSASAYWLLVYRASTGAHEEMVCRDTTTCLNAHPGQHELIEECMLTLTRCACLPMDEGYHPTFALITEMLKGLLLIAILLGAVFSGVSWNSAISQQDRNLTRDYWNAEWLRLLETVFYSVYAVAQYGATTVDHVVLSPVFWMIDSVQNRNLLRHQPLAEAEPTHTEQRRSVAERAVQTMAGTIGTLFTPFIYPRPEVTNDALLELSSTTG